MDRTSLAAGQERLREESTVMGDPFWGEDREEPTEAEEEFTELLDRLSRLNIQYIFVEDDRGPWTLVALSFTRHIDGENHAFKTLRLDFDSDGIRGGWSLHNLDGDSRVRAEPAHVDTGPPDGISMLAANHTIPELAQAAVDWSQRHWDVWLLVRDIPPRRTPLLGRLLGQPEWRYRH
jgi:hypothetical protein